MEPIDSGMFAGELRPSHAVLAKSARPPLIAQAIRTGAIAGFVPGAIVLVAYFVQNQGLPLPWITLGTEVLCVATGAGLVLAGAVQAMVLAFDRMARPHRLLTAVLNPVTAGMVAGALGGIAPGAIAVSVLGAYHSPFIGTVPIAVALIGGTLILIVPLTLRNRRARHPKATGDRRRVAVATAIATVIVLALAAVVAPLMVQIAFDRARPPASAPWQTVEHSLAVSRAVIGAIGGSVGGMVLGLYVGIAIAIGRAPRCPAPGSVR